MFAPVLLGGTLLFEKPDGGKEAKPPGLQLVSSATMCPLRELQSHSGSEEEECEKANLADKTIIHWKDAGRDGDRFQIHQICSTER